ncbi:hypothetical protein BC833DRAFT_563308 [Globomyces pollinis-pini]|nr:hypothetical protein BC833DRAFT_563308 [Globomyces pollinis-pini]
MGYRNTSKDISQSEREAARKLSHSQIERRRREKMAACMKKLSDLVPKNIQAGPLVLQKLDILLNTVEYIEEIQRQEQARNDEDYLSAASSSIGSPQSNSSVLTVYERNEVTVQNDKMKIRNLLL